jgi:(S)-ureidoglycine aminohydrolase
MPLEGFPFSRLPTWPDAQVRVLASPALGASFVQYIIDLPAGRRGGFDGDGGIETFFYVLAGSGRFDDGHGRNRDLTPGGFGLVPLNHPARFKAGEAMSLLVLRKRYEPVPPDRWDFAGHYGHESDVEKTVWADDPGALLQTLVPDDFAFDLAMNIFTFSPGHGLPVVETHVMEHGLYFLQGKGLYFLNGEWMEVEQDDFIWMGPYCPQSFYAVGPEPARYLYYKNVNREIPL